MNIIDVGLKFNGLKRWNNNPKAIVVHHVECNGWTIERLNSLHRDEFGWAGIGYHFYIRKDGSIYRGRPEDSRGAHVAEYNINSLGVAFEGDYHNVDREMPQAQFNTWVELKTYLLDKYGAMPIYGHREVGSSNCPGQYFPLDKIKSSNYESNPINNYESEDDFNMTYQNGSTREVVYADSSFTREIGSLDPREQCKAMVVDDNIMVYYNCANGKKVGFVQWTGGLQG